MKRIGAVVVFGMVGLAAWQMSSQPPQEPPCPDPWQELVETLDTESAVIDAKIARWQRFKVLRDEVDYALVHEALPLQTAAERVLSAAQADNPEFLNIAEHHAGPGAARSLTSVAKLMVHGYWLEIRAYGNRRGLDPKLLERLDYELAELSTDGDGK